MFIELAEFLRCPADHDETYCVVTPDRMVGRHIVEGTIGCPRCRQEFPIRDGVGLLTVGGVRTPSIRSAALPDVMTVAALLNLMGPGGYAVLVGSAAQLVEGLAAVIDGVHFVAVNAPADVAADARWSRVDGAARLPLRSSMARGVVLGGECEDALVADAGRVVLRGLRVVRLVEEALPTGVRELATGQGMAVGEKV